MLTIKTEDRRLETINRINGLKSEVLYIWGNGSYSRDISDYLRTAGCYEGQIRFIVDDAYYDPRDDDALPLSAFLKSGGSAREPIVFGFYNYPVILKKKAEYSSLIPHLYDFHLTVVNGKRLQWDSTLAKQREAEYQKTYELLSDKSSRQTMQLYLNAATAGEFHQLFSECYEEPAYFNHYTDGFQVDTLIDCGAFNGDSIHDFISVFPSYKRIIAIEPDQINYERLLERGKRERIRNLSAIRKGVGSHSAVLHFQSNGESNSFFDEHGEDEIQITTLDDVRAQALGTIFLKMDIEGSELDALRGADGLIREQHPIMAICVYHKEEDLIEIPRHICQTAGEGVYDYYLGFHGLDLAELVFYAIPREQLV